MKKTILSLVSTLLVVLPYFANAQLNPGRPIQTISGAWTLLCRVMNWVYTIALILSVFAVLYAAFIYLTSGGNEEKVKQANQVITYAAVGVVVALISYGVPEIIASVVFTTGGPSNVCTQTV